MGCCKCCCESRGEPGKCCGPQAHRLCCKEPDTCCRGGACCEPDHACCGLPGYPICCEQMEVCCGEECCPPGRVCCEGQCCPEGECCVDGYCAPCDCDPPCTAENCENCTQVSEGVYDCVSYCTEGQVCCGGECKECCDADDCAAGYCCVDGTCVECECDPPCSSVNCEQCTEIAPGEYDCVSTCTEGECCNDGVCGQCDCDPPCLGADCQVCGPNATCVTSCADCESCGEVAPGEFGCIPDCEPTDTCCGGECCPEGNYCCNGVCQAEPCGVTCGYCQTWAGSSDPDCPFTSDCPAVQDNCTHSCDTVQPCGCSGHAYVNSCGSQSFREVVPEEYYVCSCAAVSTYCATVECNGTGDPGFCSCSYCKSYAAYRNFVYIFNIESCQWEQLLELPGQIIDSPCSGAGEGCECPPGHTCTPPDCGSFPGCECNEFP